MAVTLCLFFTFLSNLEIILFIGVRINIIVFNTNASLIATTSEYSLPNILGVISVNIKTIKVSIIVTSVTEPSPYKLEK